MIIHDRNDASQPREKKRLPEGYVDPDKRGIRERTRRRGCLQLQEIIPITPWKIPSFCCRLTQPDHRSGTSCFVLLLFSLYANCIFAIAMTSILIFFPFPPSLSFLPLLPLRVHRPSCSPLFLYVSFLLPIFILNHTTHTSERE
ncbi:MAG: hypothetical protein JOS17DRAFT_121312 [Linnemannia elongata]|nr:MAG: hypothetical protein JOS17DRAFT_121312 [Linnemannia elongata]